MLKTQRFDLSNLPANALVGIDAIVAVGPYAKTKFYAEMHAGRAPAPVMRRAKCVRWRWSDVLAWLDSIAEGA